jgi:hypothetical protein
VKANANGSPFRIGNLAGGASIQNDVLHWVWFALGCKATPFLHVFNAPSCSELARGVFVQTTRGTGEKRQKIQIANSLSNDNAGFARARYDGSNSKENNQMTIPTKKYARQAALFGLAAAGFYLVMIFVTLTHIETLSGLRPFDMRPGGYSAELANSLINDLGPSGRRYYLTRQIPLDTVYPALMALTFVSLLKWLGSRGVSPKLVRVGIGVSIAAAIADYLENAGICLMILSWPEIPANIVLAASIASIVKSGLTTAAFLIVLFGVGVWAYKSIRTYA